jgi:hypothetical protein
MRAPERPRDDLAHDRSHRAPDELEVHRRHAQAVAAHGAGGGLRGVAQAGLFLGGADAVGVGLRVLESQGIARAQVGVVERVLAVVEEEAEVALGREGKVVAALGGHPVVLLQLLAVEDLAGGGVLRSVATRR